MKIQVGRTYLAEIPNNEDCKDWFFVVEIVAKLEIEGVTWNLGLVSKPPASNMSARLFDENGCQPDIGPYEYGMRIYADSRAKRRWSILDHAS